MRHVIIGAGVAGLTAAENILRLAPRSEVVLVSEEDRPPYSRPLISYWLAGEVPADMFPLPTEVLSALDFRRGRRAVAIDPEARRVTLDDDTSLCYDRLLLATGASARKLHLAGEEAFNVFGFRTWSDAQAIDRAIGAGARRALVLGGGLVGVKAACALRERGLEVTLAVASPQPLSQVLDPEGGALAAEALRAEGIDVRTGHAPAGFEGVAARVTAVRFSSADTLVPCDLVVRGKGVEPRGELLPLARPGGVPVDEELRAGPPDVWAAGDAALCFDRVWGAPRVNAIWPAAVEQGRVAGRNMAGASERYEGTFAQNSLRIGDLHLVSAGVFGARGNGYLTESRPTPGRGYRAVVWAGDRLAGFASAERSAIGPSSAGMVVAAVARGTRRSELAFDPLDPGAQWGDHVFASASDC